MVKFNEDETSHLRNDLRRHPNLLFYNYLLRTTSKPGLRNPQKLEVNGFQVWGIVFLELRLGDTVSHC